MAVNLSMLAGAGAQFFDNNGIPLAGGLVYTYAAGTNTPQAAYTTSAGSIAHANPIVLDSAGRTPSGGEIWLTDAVAYKFVLKTATAVTIGTYDNVTGNASGIYAAFAASSGSSLVGYTQGGTGAVATTVQAKLRQTVSVLDFGADPTGATDSTTAIQAAITAAPQGGAVYVPNGTYKVSDALVIDKALTIYGDGPGKWIDSLGGSIITQTNVAKNVFTLKASVAQYAFGQYGLNNVNFRDLAITGPSSASRCTRGIGCDTTVNSGNYHIRECTFTNIQVRFCVTGIELVGICYLNDFYSSVISQCDTGFALYRGSALESGGQTRFFGTTIDLITDTCLRWNTDTGSGDLSLFGCTLADAAYGIISNEEAQLMISGCSFENLVKTGALGAGIYIEIKEANPASDSAKTIIGNKFSANDNSIWLDKTTTALGSNSWAWPMLIDGNTLLDTVALKITLQSGEPPMSAQNFVLGAGNSGLSGGFLATSQISTNYAGRDMQKQMLTRSTTFGPSAVGTLQLPLGMVVTSARVYLTANASSFTSLYGGDGDLNTRYYTGINGQTAPLNTWTNWTPTVPQFIVNSALKQQVTLSGTAALSGAAGVFEIQGYIP